MIHWVMHLHSPEIFACRKELGLSCTDSKADYGTPEMAVEIKRIANMQNSTAGLLVMEGHQDGILVYGSNAPETGLLAVSTLSLALQTN